MIFFRYNNFYTIFINASLFVNEKLCSSVDTDQKIASSRETTGFDHGTLQPPINLNMKSNSRNRLLKPPSCLFVSRDVHIWLIVWSISRAIINKVNARWQCGSQMQHTTVTPPRYQTAYQKSVLESCEGLRGRGESARQSCEPRCTRNCNFSYLGSTWGGRAKCQRYLASVAGGRAG